MRPAALAGLVAILVLAGCDLMGLTPPEPTPIVRGGWVWPAPAPLPDGATAVPLEVAVVPDEIRPDAEYGACRLASLGSVEIAYQPDRNPPIIYRQGGNELEGGLSWQVGFSARLNPFLEIVAPDGTVIAWEGEPSRALGGGFGNDGFNVCLFEYVPRRAT